MTTEYKHLPIKIMDIAKHGQDLLSGKLFFKGKASVDDNFYKIEDENDLALQILKGNVYKSQSWVDTLKENPTWCWVWDELRPQQVNIMLVDEYDTNYNYPYRNLSETVGWKCAKPIPEAVLESLLEFYEENGLTAE